MHVGVFHIYIKTKLTAAHKNVKFLTVSICLTTNMQYNCYSNSYS